MGRLHSFKVCTKGPEHSVWVAHWRDGNVTSIYSVIKKSLCTWRLQHTKLYVMFKVSPASLQTFIDTRLTLTPPVIPNSCYVIMVSDRNCFKFFACFCTIIIRFTDILITLQKLSLNPDRKKPLRMPRCRWDDNWNGPSKKQCMGVHNSFVSVLTSDGLMWKR
jgi:hypothetical protein